MRRGHLFLPSIGANLFVLLAVALAIVLGRSGDEVGLTGYAAAAAVVVLGWLSPRRLRIPVIFSPNGFGTLDMDDPLAVGFVGRNGVFHANEAARTCDVLLALGVRFDDRSSSSWIPGYSFNIPPTRLVHVDIDPDEIGRNYPVHLGVVGDARTVLRQLLAATESSGPGAAGREAWLADIAKWHADWDAFVRPHFTGDAEPLHPQRVVQALRAVLPDDAILLPDVGVHHNWIRCRTRQPWAIGSSGCRRRAPGLVPGLQERRS